MVLQSFELSSRIWQGGATQLKARSPLVKEGEIPDFGANLLY